MRSRRRWLGREEEADGADEQEECASGDDLHATLMHYGRKSGIRSGRSGWHGCHAEQQDRDNQSDHQEWPGADRGGLVRLEG